MPELFGSVVEVPDIMNVIMLLDMNMSGMDLSSPNIVTVVGVDVVGVNIATVSLMGLIIDCVSIGTVSERISSCNCVLSDDIRARVARHT